VSAWLESFFRPTSELLVDVVDEDGGTTCSARNGTDGRDGLVAGWPRLAGGRTRAVVMSISDGYEALVSANLGKGLPFYDRSRLQRSSKPAGVSGVDNRELDNGQPVGSRRRERDCGRKRQSGVTASYSRGTDKDKVPRSEELTVMGRRMRRDQGINILSS
jgi:hypothetical protein